MGQTAALYCRVSTADQTCARQERDLRAFAKKAGYKIVGVWKETASGAKDDRAERKEVLALAQARKVDVILVTELTRWGRSMLDLFHTLQDLQSWGRFAGRPDRIAVRSAQRPGQTDRLADGGSRRIRERFTPRAGPIRNRRGAKARRRFRPATRPAHQGGPIRTKGTQAGRRRPVLSGDQPSAGTKQEYRPGYREARPCGIALYFVESSRESGP